MMRVKRVASSGALVHELGLQGNASFENGDYDQAMRCYVEVLRKTGEPLTDQRHAAARALLNIGNIHFRRGEASKSLQAFQTALRLSKSVLTDHQKYSSSSSNGSLNYCDQTVLFLSLVADSLQNIAAVRMEQGLIKEALLINTEALRLRRQCLELTVKDGESTETDMNDDEDVDRILLEIAEVLNNMGMCSEKDGDYESSIAAFKESMQIRVSILGPMHLLVAESHINLGGCYTETANFLDALEHYDASLLIRVSELGKNHADVSDNLNLIAILYLRQDKLNDALNTCIQSIDAAKYAAHVDPLKIAIALNTMGLIFEKIGLLDSALHNYTESLKVKSIILGGKAPSVASTLHNIGNIYYHNEDYDAAMMAYTECLDIMQPSLGLDQVESFQTLSNIGATYSELKRYNHAATFLRRAINSITVTKRRVDKHLVAETYNFLGIALREQGKHGEAKENFSLALDVYASCEVTDESNTGAHAALSNLSAL